jgi:ribonuclease D
MSLTTNFTNPTQDEEGELVMLIMAWREKHARQIDEKAEFVFSDQHLKRIVQRRNEVNDVDDIPR